ncbi:MAG: 4Fe-4S binding protein [Limnochordia bacterium]|jgi:ferredoxin
MKTTLWQQVTWLLMPIIALGGLYYHKLGLLLLPIMLTLIVLGVFRGKYWCGKLCPHGSLFDVVLKPFTSNKRTPKILGSGGFRLVLFGLYMFMFIRRVARVLPLFGTLGFWDKLGLLLAINYLVPTVLGTVLALTIRRRAWCWICPMETMQQAAYWFGSKTGLNRGTDVRVTQTNLANCKDCGKCSRVCPMGIQLPTRDQLADPRCIKCGICVANCPTDLLQLEKTRLPSSHAA